MIAGETDASFRESTRSPLVLSNVVCPDIVNAITRSGRDLFYAVLSTRGPEENSSEKVGGVLMDGIGEETANPIRVIRRDPELIQA